eukprot:GILK01013696.1.p1 GENE.GILK01013696.1~~GILK01013696.1.p1  ORF type:complete len:140 (-),score=0.55 GILK01013696.1:219-638(-)
MDKQKLSYLYGKCREIGRDRQPNTSRFHKFYVNAIFRSGCCNRVWRSDLAWIKLDVDTGRVKSWGQKCKISSCSRRQYTLPNLTFKEINRVLELLADRIENPRASIGGTRQQPSNHRRAHHQQSLCELCQELGRACYAG